MKEPDTIADYYTLAMGQVNFDELPHELVKTLPGTLLVTIQNLKATHANFD